MREVEAGVRGEREEGKGCEGQGKGEGGREGGEEMRVFTLWATKTRTYIRIYPHVMLAHTLAAAILVLASLT